MQYLVSVENSNYFYWQLELLIESFLMHGLQDSLVISMAENDSPKLSGYSKNLIKYGKKIIHANVGKERDFLPANRFYSIHRLLESGDLNLPFCVIHSDMLLKNPIDKYNKETDVVINNYDVYKNTLTVDYIKNSSVKENLIKEGFLKGTEDEDRVDEIIDEAIENFPYSMPIIFNESIGKELMLKFSEKLVVNLEELIKTKNQKQFPIEKTCWTYTFLESLGRYTASGEFLTCELAHAENLDVPFIHYKNGIPPVFNKKFFKFEQGKYYEGPYEILVQNNLSENTEYMIQIIKSYMKRNK